MDVDHFCKYFNNAPVVFVEGRTFPVHIHNAVKPHEDYFFSVLSTIFQLHQSAPVKYVTRKVFLILSCFFLSLSSETVFLFLKVF